MEMGKLSPGPWTVDGIMVFAPSGKPVAMVRDADDARAIATLPKLLEALKDVVFALGTIGEVPEGVFQRAKTAIAEAEGRAE